MQIKTFRAINMRQALAKVKAEMGSNAIILSRTKVKNGGAFGIFSRPLVEVAAALDEDVRDKHMETRRNRGSKSQKSSKEFGGNPPHGGVETAVENVLGPIRQDIQNIKELIGSTVNAETFGRAELKKAAGLAEDICDMKNMVGFMLEQSDFYKGIGLPRNHLACYRRMVERGVEPEFALKIIRGVIRETPAGPEMEPRRIVERVMDRISESMILGDSFNGYDDSPQVVSFIGPTGAGKTTTIAKIAAGLAMKGKKVGLITIDTYRIAAVEQLKIYADIIKIPLLVALTPDELTTAVSSYSGKDVILIDTAGRSQRDVEKLEELSSFMGGNGLVENHLVLSAASDPAALNEAVANFGCVPLAGLIFTKLDESRKPGVVISQNLKTGLPIVYYTTGQKVPEDIKESRCAPEFSARLFMKNMA
ncbi:MAG: flagellar biosynthesis protein FlhF [bacterium]|nr:MAG: flagellar biosynthesis protein FlhF [bacterium]